MTKISAFATATAVASLLLMGAASAQTAAPAKTEAPKAAPAAKTEKTPVVHSAASLECSKEAKREAAPTAAPAAPAGPAVFPNAVDPKYAKESEGKQRMHTCVDQYNANKTTGGNGGLKWIQKGGGYYSECTRKLKGAA